MPLREHGFIELFCFLPPLILVDKPENLLSSGQICKHITDDENSEDIPY